MEVEEFIHRRFKVDCDWKSGNCYYFAVILKTRFSQGKIMYDVVNGHFVFELNNSYYDYSGKIICDKENLVDWDNFKMYDSIRFERILDGCVL